MASTPKTPAKSARPARPAADEADEASPADEADAPAPQTPPPVRTIADEQRERSAEIMAVGVEEWKEEHDERSPEERKSHQVPGVAPPAPEGGSWQGSTRSTPAARAAQNPSASR